MQANNRGSADSGCMIMQPLHWAMHCPLGESCCKSGLRCACIGQCVSSSACLGLGKLLLHGANLLPRHLERCSIRWAPCGRRLCFLLLRLLNEGCTEPGPHACQLPAQLKLVPSSLFHLAKTQNSQC